VTITSGEIPVLNLILNLLIAAFAGLLAWSLRRHVKQYDDWRDKTEDRLEALLAEKNSNHARREIEMRLSESLDRRLSDIMHKLDSLADKLDQKADKNTCVAIHRQMVHGPRATD
jgi:hypothetical protein